MKIATGRTKRCYFCRKIVVVKILAKEKLATILQLVLKADIFGKKGLKKIKKNCTTRLIYLFCPELNFKFFEERTKKFTIFNFSYEKSLFIPKILKQKTFWSKNSTNPRNFFDSGFIFWNNSIKLHVKFLDNE